MTAHISIPLFQRAIKQRYRLVGHRCHECGKINFPPKGVCKYCRASSSFEEIKLSGRGKVYSYTILAAGGAPPEFAEEALIKDSYPVVLVELEEGPKIIAQLVDVPDDGVRIGLEVEAVIRRIYVEEEVIRYGYKFRPIPVKS
ncbi:hypothetical protein SY88_15705 [Clostridiales bacterium PH28_bin88]|nr:hypothetical protein SY88_15705 [Clostridiales bacterium PH28_bin88]